MESNEYKISVWELEKIFEKCTERQYQLKQNYQINSSIISAHTVANVWDAFSKWTMQTLEKGNSVIFPNFGTIG